MSKSHKTQETKFLDVFIICIFENRFRLHYWT